MIQQLDPYKVGEVVGPAAFNSGDYIVIRRENNRPGVVEDKGEMPGLIKVRLGDKSRSVYGVATYYASDLGYPLSQDLWSQTQKDWYDRCHKEKWLTQRWT